MSQPLTEEELEDLLASESQGRASTPQERAQYIRDVARVRAEARAADAELIAELKEALLCDGNNIRAYTLLDWCADRLSRMANKVDVINEESQEEQGRIVEMLRRKGGIARAALAKADERKQS